MKTKIKTALKIIGAVMVLRGLQLTFVMLRSFWRGFRIADSYYLEHPFAAGGTIILTLIAAGLAVAGFGLWKEKVWSRKFAIFFLSSDFCLRLYGAVNAWTYLWRHPGQKQLYNQMTAQASNGANYTISMIPSYIQGLLALAIVIFLMSKPARTYFSTLASQDPLMDVKHDSK